MKIVTAHQYMFLPWQGYFNKMAHADVFVSLGEAEFDRSYFTHRSRLHGSWMTLPLNRKTIQGPCSGVDISDRGFPRKIGKRIQQELFTKKYAYHERLVPLVDLLLNPHDLYGGSARCSLVRIIEATNSILHEILGLGAGEDSTMRDGLPLEGATKTERLVNAIGPVSGDVLYLSGASGRLYLNEAELPDSWRVLYQKTNPEMDAETVLKIIATHADPLHVIRNCATWETRNYEDAGCIPAR